MVIKKPKNEIAMAIEQATDKIIAAFPKDQYFSIAKVEFWQELGGKQTVKFPALGAMDGVYCAEVEIPENEHIIYNVPLYKGTATIRLPFKLVNDGITVQVDGRAMHNGGDAVIISGDCSICWL